ncbi:MAG TPA: adenylate/guanylate cyclase domain-containing protein, partial [Acidimicrobiia bacterium]
ADLEAYSDAAFWAGHPVTAIEAAEQAFARHQVEGRSADAAAAGLRVTRLQFMHGHFAVSAGWFEQVQRLLADLPECAAHGHARWIEGLFALGLNDTEQALTIGREVEQIGRRVSDRDVTTLGVSMQGMVEVRAGETQAGLRHLDEALAAAIGGELGHFATAEVTCEMVMACVEVTDYERAIEWLDAAERSGRELVCFPGCCRTHRATVQRHRGEWDIAHDEATRARDEAAGLEVMHEGMALYELAELHRRRGEAALAEDAFTDAHERGWSPQPGLALVHLARGDIGAAAAMIDGAVSSSAQEPGILLELLPAKVTIALAAHDIAGAEQAVEQLAGVGARIGSTAAAAAAVGAAAAVDEANGDLTAARVHATEAVRAWQRAKNPYEVGRSRLVLARALQALGDPASARLELASARKAFERLHATRELREATRLLGDERPRYADATFMFTDLVESTRYLSAVGDDAWHAFRQLHDRTLRALVSDRHGRVVKNTGDGVFAAFDDPHAAMSCAIAIQRAVAGPEAEDAAPAVRIGLHSGSAIVVEDDFTGRDVVIAARIGALAGAGDIFITRDLAGVLPGDATASSRGPLELKGIPEPVEVLAVHWA